MLLTPEQRTIVQSTFDLVTEDGTKFAAAFYDKLFEINPDLRKLFNRDMVEQGDLIVRMLFVVVRGLDYVDNVVPALHDIGLHHKGYGVKPEDYITFRTALKHTLSESLGHRFTPEISQVWDVFLSLLTNSALEGAAAG